MPAAAGRTPYAARPGAPGARRAAPRLADITRMRAPAGVKVSVVIPVYNAEKYLDECVGSALDQTHGDAEVIAVDDGSTDSSAEVLDGYADRVRVIRKPNGGTASALNRGAREMSGEWFKWLSADDALKPHALEALAGAARSAERPERRIFYADFDHVNLHGRRIKRYDRAEPDNNGKTDLERNAVLLHHFYGNGTTSMFHRSVFEMCGPFDESIGFAEDYEFWLRCCLLHGYRLHLVPRNIARYRVHESQLTRTRAGGMDANNERIRSMVLARLPEDERGRYVEAAALVRDPPPSLSTRARTAAHRALFACVPGRAAEAAVRTYHRARNDGLYTG